MLIKSASDYKRAEAGFTLLEIMMAVLVLAIGLLGMAGLHVVGQRNNHSAYLRSQAVLQVYDMADRMRANLAAVVAGNYKAIAATAPGTAPTPNCKTAANGCTPAQLASFDVWEWKTLTISVLPSGQSSITFDTVTETYTINVAWDDNRDGNVDLNNADVSLRDPDFKLEFAP